MVSHPAEHSFEPPQTLYDPAQALPTTNGAVSPGSSVAPLYKPKGTAPAKSQHPKASRSHKLREAHTQLTPELSPDAKTEPADHVDKAGTTQPPQMAQESVHTKADNDTTTEPKEDIFVKGVTYEQAPDVTLEIDEKEETYVGFSTTPVPVAQAEPEPTQDALHLVALQPLDSQQSGVSVDADTESEVVSLPPATQAAIGECADFNFLDDAVTTEENGAVAAAEPAAHLQEISMNGTLLDKSTTHEVQSPNIDYVEAEAITDTLDDVKVPLNEEATTLDATSFERSTSLDSCTENVREADFDLRPRQASLEQDQWHRNLHHASPTAPRRNMGLIQEEANSWTRGKGQRPELNDGVRRYSKADLIALRPVDLKTQIPEELSRWYSAQCLVYHAPIEDKKKPRGIQGTGSSGDLSWDLPAEVDEKSVFSGSRKDAYTYTPGAIAQASDEER
jgi:hypothetical protein